MTIRDGRIRAMMTQEQLAEKLGVTRVTVAHWELGDFLPSLNNIRKIAEVLGRDVAEDVISRRIAVIDSKLAELKEV